MNVIVILATVVIRLASYGGGASFEGGDTEVETCKPGWLGRALGGILTGAPAAVWASSPDGRPLAESGRILVVHLTDMQGEGNVYADATRQILLKWGKGCLVEKGTAQVALLHPGDLTAWSLDTMGHRVKELPIRRNGEWILLDCSTAEGAIYYELESVNAIQRRGSFSTF